MQTAPELKHLRSINQIANAKTKKTAMNEWNRRRYMELKQTKKKHTQKTRAKNPKKKQKNPKTIQNTPTPNNLYQFLQSRRSRGYCFVYFLEIDDATTAKESCANLTIDSRRVRVDYSITTRAHTPTPGIYKGCSTVRRRHNRERDRDEHRRANRSRYGSRSRYRRSRSHSPRSRK